MSLSPEEWRARQRANFLWYLSEPGKRGKSAEQLAKQIEALEAEEKRIEADSADRRTELKLVIARKPAVAHGLYEAETQRILAALRSSHSELKLIAERKPALERALFEAMTPEQRAAHEPKPTTWVGLILDAMPVEELAKAQAKTQQELLAKGEQEKKERKKKKKKEKPEAFLARLLASGQRVEAETVQNLAEKAGYSLPAMKRAKRKLGAITERIGFGPGSTCYWRLPHEPSRTP